jgi:hypothetical protein
MNTGALKYADFMAKTSLKLFTGIALPATVAWTAYEGGAPLSLAAVLMLLCVALFWVRSSSSSRFRTELLHDPAVSTLVFPPESKLQ